MRSVILTVAMTMFLPAALAAQEPAAGRVSDAKDAVAGATPLDGRPEAAMPAPAPQMAQRVAARRSDNRRRGSMVGYIDDATVTSQVRLRFDGGFHIDTPDRAEFFYAKCGCYRDLPSNNAAFDPNAPGPGPGVVTDLNFQQLYLQGEFALKGRVSVFAELPVRWIQPKSFVAGTGSFPNQSGMGDLRAGVKVGLVATDDRSLTFQVRTDVPKGDARKGLGTGHWSIEPALLYQQRITDRLGIEGQVGDWHPTGGSAGVPTSSSEKFAHDVFFYGIGPSFDVVSTDRVRFTPIAELVGWRVLGGFQTGDPADAGGLNIVNLKLGARTTVAGRNSFYVGYGWALTSAVWYDKVLRVEYRYGF